MSALDNVCFLYIKDRILPHMTGGFRLDPSVPLPIRTVNHEMVKAEDITIESVLSGILTIAAHDAHNPNIDYYRALLVSVKPDIKQELNYAAIYKARCEEWADAQEMFASLVGLFGDDMAVVLNTAVFLDERGTSYRKSGLEADAEACDSEAFSLYKKAMDALNPAPDAFFNAGFFYMKLHSFHEAKECFETYVALTCDIKDDKLGENGVYKKERAQEIIDYISSQCIDDKHFQKAYALINSGKEEEALDEVRHFITANPNVWNAWFLLGWALRRLSRYNEAKEAFEQSLEIVKTLDLNDDSKEWKDALSNTYNELAICFMECGRLSEARRALRTALSIDSENAKVMSNLGFVALKEGNKDDAKKYFRVALEYDKNDKIARAQLELLGD